MCQKRHLRFVYEGWILVHFEIYEYAEDLLAVITLLCIEILL